MSIDRQSRIPLYLQLKDIIIKRIINGEYKPDGMMKTEHELCEEFQMSRYPVRQALGELVEEGYIFRIPKWGTFIRGDALKDNIVSVDNKSTKKSVSES